MKPLKFAIETFWKTGALLGFAAFVTAIAVIILDGDNPLQSDDPYIGGFAIACYLFPGILLYYIFEHFPNRFVGKYRAILIWVVGTNAFFFLTTYFSSSNEARACSDIVVYLLGYLALLLPVLWLMARWLDKIWLRILGWTLGAIWGLGLLYIYAVVFSSRTYP